MNSPVGRGASEGPRRRDSSEGGEDLFNLSDTSLNEKLRLLNAFDKKAIQAFKKELPDQPPPNTTENIKLVAQRLIGLSKKQGLSTILTKLLDHISLSKKTYIICVQKYF